MYPLVSCHSYGKWPVYTWFLMIYNTHLQIVFFHSYVKLLEGNIRWVWFIMIPKYVCERVGGTTWCNRDIDNDDDDDEQEEDEDEGGGGLGTGKQYEHGYKLWNWWCHRNCQSTAWSDFNLNMFEARLQASAFFYRIYIYIYSSNATGKLDALRVWLVSLPSPAPSSFQSVSSCCHLWQGKTADPRPCDLRLIQLLDELDLYREMPIVFWCSLACMPPSF